MLNDPYDYLGISRNATEQQVMDAYRKLAGEIQNSNMSEGEKAERMNELNNAYDIVVNEMRGTSSYQNTSDSYYDYSSSSSQFSDVRQRINSGRIDDAETILNGIPASMRTAEWHYLKGVIHQRRGWLNEAYRCYQTACSIDPSNAEYAAALNAMNGNIAGGYRTSSGRGGVCETCAGLLCADACCECMGGDCIPCC